MDRYNNKSNCVCVFDSGIGGLTLFAQCIKKYPDVDFTYFADNYNVPYGSRSPQEIWRLTDSIFKEIDALQPLAAVVACNTVTAECIGALREKYSFPILGIQPAIKPATEKGGRCLVLATKATVESDAFLSLVARYGNSSTVVRACPEMAEYIERHVDSYPHIDVSKFLPRIEARSVVLGCTHYTFAEQSIRGFYGCQIYDGILGTADHLGAFLGTADHRSLISQKISFKNGNIDKNREVLLKLLNEK